MNAEITVIGAGVIGLAITEKLSERFPDVYLIERHGTFGQETSSRNSEVIHAGIYYRTSSLKAQLCTRGKMLLYDYCKKYQVPFNNCGKLIVAVTKEETCILEGIKHRAALNGVKDLSLINKEQIAEMEPEIIALKALFSPSTGIVDSHSLMKQYETSILNNGGLIAYGNEVTGIRKVDKGYEITTLGPDNRYFTFTSKKVINSAGLQADRIAAMVGIRDEELRIVFCKGEYFSINHPHHRLVKRLVYPVPHPRMEGIGIHLTIDMGGGARLGPDVTWIDSNTYDYRVDPAKQTAFFQSAGKFLPFLRYEDLSPCMAGIRPKIQKPGGEERDFYIREEADRGLPGFINLIGMESPGLTSSLAIAEYVSDLIYN